MLSPTEQSRRDRYEKLKNRSLNAKGNLKSSELSRKKIARPIESAMQDFNPSAAPPRFTLKVTNADGDGDGDKEQEQPAI